MINLSRLSFKFIVFVTACSSLTLVLIARLIDVQLLQGYDFRVKADDNRFYSLVAPAERGVFLDRYNQPLVWNTRRYYSLSNPHQLHQNREAIDRQTALALMATSSAGVVATLERTYRWPEALSHVLGFVGAVTAEDLAKNNSVTLQEQLGKLGLELSQQQKLRGADGFDKYEINALGKRQKKVAVQLAEAGETITTTLDPHLSEVAYQAMDGRKGAVVIMDAENGEVLTLISSPTFDANVLTQSTVDPTESQKRKQNIQAFFADPRQLFFNRAIDGAYPPGSIFKLVTALAALEDGKIDESTEVIDEGTLKVGEYEYGNWYFRQYGRTEGSISLVKALARSNDIYFYKVAEWVGPNGIASMAKMFGLGQKTDIELSPQVSGLVPDPAWKEKTLGERWYLGNTYHYGIGQGDLLLSPLQAAQMVQAVGNKGTMCSPTLIKNNTTNCTTLGLQTENLRLVLAGMLEACSAGGTAYPFFPFNAAHRVIGATVDEDLAAGAVACKTGTAEFGAADANDQRKTHGWFVAVVGVDQEKLTGVTEESSEDAIGSTSLATRIPQSELRETVPRTEWFELVKKHGFPKKLAFAVLVESDEAVPFREGSGDASPIVKQIVDWMEGV